MIRATLTGLIVGAGLVIGLSSHTVELAGLVAHNACADMSINACAELDTSAVTDTRGASVPVGDLHEIVAVATDDGAPADLVACWIANGAVGDPTDGSETLYASRLVIDGCNPIGWVSA